MESSSFGICNMAKKINSAERGVIAALMLFFASSCAIPEFQATDWSTNKAVVRGKTKEALASLEAQAQEAEKNASVSWFPQAYWVAATQAYSQASKAAIYSGQLEKSIAYGEKALETAEKITEFIWVPGCSGCTIKIQALASLAEAYKSVRSLTKARGLIERRLEIVSGIPESSRINFESSLYRDLGEELIRSGEHTKAIETL